MGGARRSERNAEKYSIEWMATRGDQEFIGAPFHPEERGVEFWPASQRPLGRAPTVISTQARTAELGLVTGRGSVNLCKRKHLTTSTAP